MILYYVMILDGQKIDFILTDTNHIQKEKRFVYLFKNSHKL